MKNKYLRKLFFETLFAGANFIMAAVVGLTPIGIFWLLYEINLLVATAGAIIGSAVLMGIYSVVFDAMIDSETYFKEFIAYDGRYKDLV